MFVDLDVFLAFFFLDFFLAMTVAHSDRSSFAMRQKFGETQKKKKSSPHVSPVGSVSFCLLFFFSFHVFFSFRGDVASPRASGKKKETKKQKNKKKNKNKNKRRTLYIATFPTAAVTNGGKEKNKTVNETEMNFFFLT